MTGIGPTPMRLSHGTGSQLDFRRKKKSRSRWLFRGALAVLLLVVLIVRFAPLIEGRTVVHAPVAPEAPRVIQMN